MDILEKNCIILITKEGDLVPVPRVEGEKNHSQAYMRLGEQVPELLDEFPYDLKVSGGYELANYAAASGNVVIWPSNINYSDNIIVTIPKNISDTSCDVLESILPALKEYKPFVTQAYYKKPNSRSKKIICQSICNSDAQRENSIDTIEKYIQMNKEFNKANDNIAKKSDGKNSKL